MNGYTLLHGTVLHFLDFVVSVGGEKTKIEV